MPGYRIALVCIGINFTLTALYVGSELALSLGLGAAVRATIIGSIVLTFMSIPAAMVGSGTRLSTYMIVSHVFGRSGSVAVNVLLGTALLGWYALTAELFGRTCYISMVGYLPGVPQWGYTLCCSVLVMATTLVGFRAIERLSLFAAPLLVALIVYVAWRSLGITPRSEMVSATHPHGDFGEAVSAVIGSMIVGVLLMPDITRYCASTFDCVVVSVVGNGLGNTGALILSMLPALAFHELDPMKYMGLLGLTGLGFAILLVSTWTMNAVNLYSTALVVSAALRSSAYGRIVLWCGSVGTLLAAFGVADRLVQFLVVLGLIVPPVAAVYLTDYLAFRRRDYTDSVAAGGDSTNVNGVLACLCGALVGLMTYFRHTSLTGIPTIESFVSASVFYTVAELVRVRGGLDRGWRRLTVL